MRRALVSAIPVVLLTTGVCLLAGCPAGLSSVSTRAAVAPFEIPPPRVTHPALSADLASLIYPDPEQIGRDPFLTVQEEALADGKDMSLFEPPKPVVVVESTPHKRIYVPPPPKPRIIRQLHDEVHGIILGKHNTFEFRGQLYEEGDVIEKSEWVVQNISEAGIRLRTKDGSGSDFLKFSTEAAINFEFNGSSAPSSKGERPVQSATKQF